MKCVEGKKVQTAAHRAPFCSSDAAAAKTAQPFHTFDPSIAFDPVDPGPTAPPPTSAQSSNPCPCDCH